MSVIDPDTVVHVVEDSAAPRLRPVADLEHPWLGLESFREETRAYFFGRDTEITEIHLRLRSYPLLVVYGRSGLGKTSILNAGLIPQLRAEGQQPVLHRLDYTGEGVFEQLFSALFRSDKTSPLARALDKQERIASWERNMMERVADSAPLPRDPPSRLWLRLHSRQEPPDITHLILDQFEEVFTARRPGAENEVRDALAIVLQCAIPKPIVQLIADRDDFVDYFDPDSTPVRVLLALRDDYVYALNRWKSSLPSLGQNNFELHALRGPAALDAVFEPGALRCRYRGEVSDENRMDTGLPPIVSKDSAQRIVRFVARKSGDVPMEEIEAVPPILSLLCRELNERRFAPPAGTTRKPAEQINFSEGDTDVETIIKSFYERCIIGRPESVRIFIEEELVSYSGARLAQDEKSILSAFEKGWRIPGAGIDRRASGYGDPARARACLDELVNDRLLTSTMVGETPSYELIHDLLAAVVEKSRITREALGQAEQLRAAEAAQRRKQRMTAAIALALALTLVGTIWGGYYAFVQEHREYYRQLGKRRGSPVGIIQISEAEARRLPVSFRLVHKGIVRNGWKLHWKPAFRVEAVNGLLELTTNHGVYAYLWKGDYEAKDSQDKSFDEKGERLRLRTVCQWEYVLTTNNKIIYERALDRDGRMVYGLIYSPPTPGSSANRLARFVGPDGFPQLQRRSAAEYVDIHYDDAGWEDRIMYRDGKNQPAAGPDGAFGQSVTHNSSGQITSVLSLDTSGKPMIDKAGNCGMLAKYDASGYDVEETSVGPDRKPLSARDGFVIAKNEYDAYGRLRRETYHDARGEPVQQKNGYHGWVAKYDTHGNQVVVTYMGVDRKPVTNVQGYATLRMDYDSHGNITQVRSYGVHGEPVWDKDGYHGWDIRYDAHGNRILETYLGLDGKPALMAEGYSTLKMTYNARGRRTGATFYGVNGEPVLSKNDHYHGWKAEYDERGNKTAETYLGVDGKPAPNVDGYVTARMAYDIRGKQTEAKYYGAKGEPVVSRKNGYHGWEAIYDEQGNNIAETYFGADGKPTLVPEGYATIKMSYDSRGNRVRTKFFGVNGEPVLSSNDGFHGWWAEYDEHGNRTAVTHFGLDSKPILLPDGYAKFKSKYDERGNQIETRYYGVHSEPVVSTKYGYHGWQAEYDEHNNQTLVTYLGATGQPATIPEGYAILKMTYDAADRRTGASYYGTRGEPALWPENGYHGWRAEYDEQGNQTSTTYLGLDEKPTLLADGYAILRMAYDSRGKQTEARFFGVNGEPVLSKEKGYHGWRTEYDERGNQTSAMDLGLDGKPMLRADGVAILKMAYDARGNLTRVRFFGVKGEPVLLKEKGCHGWDATYDEEGKERSKTYLDRAGKPISPPEK